MMKLALIRQRYNPHGGAERFVSRALETLSENNELKITLLTRKWKNAASNNKNNYQIEICNPFYLGNVWRDWSFARAIQTQLATQSFDLIQSHERIAGRRWGASRVAFPACSSAFYAATCWHASESLSCIYIASGI